MNRRQFGATLAAALLHARLAGAAPQRCAQTPYGVRCRSEVQFERFRGAYAMQEFSQWCWAACISMIFAYHGRPVSQARIVAEAYGGVVNMPALAGIVIANQLNRNWYDDHRRPFSARVTAAYDFDARVNALDNATIVRELEMQRPIVLGTANHAVVVTAVDHVPTQMGPNIVGVGVFDPWPGRGARALTQMEMVPMHMGGALRFAATVSVR